MFELSLASSVGVEGSTKIKVLPGCETYLDRYVSVWMEDKVIINKPPILEKLAPGVKVLAPVSMSETYRSLYADTTVKSVNLTSGYVEINPIRK
jgi:hypothetical protein